MRTIIQGTWVGLSSIGTRQFKVLVIAAVFSLVFAAESVAAKTRSKSASANAVSARTTNRRAKRAA